MPGSKPPYPAEFKRKLVVLFRSGRSQRSLAEEYDVTETSVRTWIRQADLDEGVREDGLTTTERDEIRHLRRENARLREERDILSKAAAWFAQARVGTPKKRSDS